MNKSESKYFNTALKMDKAFIELIDKKDYEFITVKEICTKAGVNRSTFYLHYETMEDLLRECIELQFKTLYTYFPNEHAHISERVKDDSLDDLYFITDKYLIPYLTFIQDNKKMFKTVLKHPNVFHTKNTYNLMYSYIMDPILEKYHIPKENRKYIIAFYIQGIMGIIREWLQDDCNSSIENITNIIKQCSVRQNENSHK